MRRIALILLLLLCGAGPAQKRLLLQGEPSLEQLIRQHAPTLWLDSSDPGTITATAGAISQWSDKSGNGRHFVQATEGAKPVRTRSDNRENQIPNSAGLGTWTASYSSSTANAIANPVNGEVDAVLLQEDGTAGRQHYLAGSSVVSVIAGHTYRVSIYAKAKERFIFRSRFCCNIAGHIHVNLNTGAVLTESKVSNVVIDMLDDGWVRLSCEVVATGTGGISYYPQLCNDSNQDTYNGDGSSGLYIYGPQIQDAAADSIYTETTGAKLFRGVNGRAAVRFDGAASYMTSAATLENIFGANAKTAFIVTRNPTLSVDQIAFSDSGNNVYFQSLAATPNIWRFINNDGSADNVQVAAIINRPNILMGVHGSSLVNMCVNGSCGTAAASGDTSSLAETLRLGVGYTQYFNGQIAELITFNKVLPSDVRDRIQRGLCKKWGADC